MQNNASKPFPLPACHMALHARLPSLQQLYQLAATVRTWLCLGSTWATKIVAWATEMVAWLAHSPSAEPEAFDSCCETAACRNACAGGDKARKQTYQASVRGTSLKIADGVHTHLSTCKQVTREESRSHMRAVGAGNEPLAMHTACSGGTDKEGVETPEGKRLPFW